MDITTRRSAADLLVIGMVLRVSERLPLVATSTLGCLLVPLRDG